MSNQSGTGKGRPSEDRALEKTRREVKLLEESLRRETKENEQRKRKIDRLEKENEKLKKELATKRQPPKWAKANKSKEKKKTKKRGPKAGHTPHLRTTPQEIDREIALVPKQCPACDSKLPNPSKWHSHTQIDLPPPPKAIVTRYHVGWCYCSHCKKEV